TFDTPPSDRDHPVLARTLSPRSRPSLAQSHVLRAFCERPALVRRTDPPLKLRVGRAILFPALVRQEMIVSAHAEHGHEHGHMHDYEGHVEALEADLEYWRTKRLEPYFIRLHRRGIVTLYDLMRSVASVVAPAAGEAKGSIETRIRAL